MLEEARRYFARKREDVLNFLVVLTSVRFGERASYGAITRVIAKLFSDVSQAGT